LCGQTTIRMCGGKRHVSTPRSWRSRGVCSMPHRGDVCSTIVTVKVVVPLLMALDDGVAVLSERQCSSSSRRSVTVRLAVVGVCDMDGVRDNASDGSGVQREWLAHCPL
jgi:hypothetical protein